MADRTSAEIFGDLFIALAKDFDKAPEAVQLYRLKLAKQFWKKSEGEYDFSDDQMGCDKALVTLKLCPKCEGCKELIYRPYLKEDHKGCS